MAMQLAPSCPRCPEDIEVGEDAWTCPSHGSVVPLWRPETPSYDAFAEHLLASGSLPTWLPWPLPPGWVVHDFGAVAVPGADASATFASCSGSTALDGVVEVTVVSEEPGVGLGARCAGILRTDPGGQITGPPAAKLHLDGHPISLWSVSTSDDDVGFDRSVLAGEAQGRWVWLVLRPASAALLLTEQMSLFDVSGLGPALVGLPFGSVPPAW